MKRKDNENAFCKVIRKRISRTKGTNAPCAAEQEMEKILKMNKKGTTQFLLL